MILVRHQTAGHFRESLARQHGLRALARISAPDTADVERRTAGVAFERRITGFAEHIVHIDSFVVGFLRERYLRYHRPFLFGDRQHVVIETRNGDFAVFVHYLRQHLAKGVHGVLHRSAEMPRVQVSVRTIHFDLPVRQTAQTGGDRGCLFADHGGVGYQDNIGFEEVFVFL